MSAVAYKHLLFRSDARAIEKVGAEGAVTVEEAKGTETVMDVVEGLQFDRGYLSAYFVTDAEKMETILDEPEIPETKPEPAPALEG